MNSIWRRLASALLVLYAASAAVSVSAADSNVPKLVLTPYTGFLYWSWQNKPSSPVVSYHVSAYAPVPGSNPVALPSTPLVTYTTTDNYLVLADHGYSDPDLKNYVCVFAKLADGETYNSGCYRTSNYRPFSHLISLRGGPSTVWKMNGQIQPSVGPPVDSMISNRLQLPKGIDGYAFSSADSVYLATVIYSYLPSTTKTVVTSGVAKIIQVPESAWQNDVTMFDTATTSTPDSCYVHDVQVLATGEISTAITPLHDNVDCVVTASSHVPFLSDPDYSATFTIHFEQLPPTLVFQPDPGHIYPMVGSTIPIFALQTPYFVFAGGDGFFSSAEIPLASQSLTPKTCSVKVNGPGPGNELDLKGLSIGTCTIQMNFPQSTGGGGWNYFDNPRYLTPVVSPAVTRTFSFPVTAFKRINIGKSGFSCQIVDLKLHTMTLVTAVNKKAAPVGCVQPAAITSG